MEQTPVEYRSGFVALAGKPNVGKSTLVNGLLGTELSIVTPKPQTTRHRIKAILSGPAAQIVFVDTPGIHASEALLNRTMVETATKSMKEADVVLVVITPLQPLDDADRTVFELVSVMGKPAVLAINKIDLVAPEVIPPFMDACSKLVDFRAIVPISAMKGTGLEHLVTALTHILPCGPPLFPEDDVSDLPVRFFVAEMVREQIIKLTGEEIPYKTAVLVETFEERNAFAVIHVDIHVERPSQKKILVGKGGAMIKRIGMAARRKIEAFLGYHVHLELFVKVSPRWTKDPKMLDEFGYKA